ncbi:unnamed protein product [Mycena citricolor]|uniref:Uncharacterized protein n=1 Tax=Mycena citricolor TaxID=2018698 RepID=A0AAD2Q1W6_9AGAR|nr:unnamed protein product [Mycena citricolor]
MTRRKVFQHLPHLPTPSPSPKLPQLHHVLLPPLHVYHVARRARFEADDRACRPSAEQWPAVRALRMARRRTREQLPLPLSTEIHAYSALALPPCFLPHYNPRSCCAAPVFCFASHAYA